MQLSLFTSALSSTTFTASDGQASSHDLHPLHSSLFTMAGIADSLLITPLGGELLESFYRLGERAGIRAVPEVGLGVFADLTAGDQHNVARIDAGIHGFPPPQWLAACPDGG